MILILKLQSHQTKTICRLGCNTSIIGNAIPTINSQTAFQEKGGYRFDNSEHILNIQANLVMAKHKMLGFVEIIYANACDDYYTTNTIYRLCKYSSHTFVL